MASASGLLTVDAVPAKIPPDGPEVIRFSLTARGCPGGDINAETLEKWFEVAREYIVRGFVDLTTRQTDAIWEREL